MSTLTSVKRTAKERKVEQTALAMPEREQYPYGLSIQLDDDTLEKLGLKTLPKVGAAMMLTARVTVKSVSTNEGESREKRRDISLQITDMALDAEKPSKSTSETMYEKS